MRSRPPASDCGGWHGVERPGDWKHADWLGHTEAIADEFYRQVRDDDFKRAIGEGGTGAAQNPAQSEAESARTEPQPVAVGAQKGPDFPGDSAVCGSMQSDSLPPRGVEPLSSG